MENKVAEIQLFKLGDKIEELKASCAIFEKNLQNIIENNMDIFFSVRFLANEYRIDAGRIDSIGIDENNSPVIFEYKRNLSENIINQGLFYLNWLKGHKDSFKLLVIGKLGQEAANKIDWSMPHIICIANDFSKYDSEAIREMTSSVSLIRYKQYDSLLLFELVNNNTNYLNRNKNKTLVQSVNSTIESEDKKDSNLGIAQRYQIAPKKLKDIFDLIKEYALSLGDDVTEAEYKYYLALKKIKNFATMQIYPKKIIMHFKLNPTKYLLTDKLRDVTNIGHLGCGNLEFVLYNDKDIAFAKELLEKAYNEN